MPFVSDIKFDPTPKAGFIGSDEITFDEEAPSRADNESSAARVSGFEQAMFAPQRTGAEQSIADTVLSAEPTPYKKTEYQPVASRAPDKGYWDAESFIKKDIPNIVKSAPTLFNTGMAKTVGGIERFLGEDTSGGEGTVYGFGDETKREGFGILGDPTALRESGTALSVGALETEEETKAQYPVKTKAGELLQGAVSSIGQQIPALALSVGGLGGAGLSLMGIQSFGTAYAEDRAKGRSPEDAAANAVVNGITEPATEMLPFAKFAKGMKSGFSTKVLRGFMLGELAGEHVATAVENSFDVSFNEPDKNKRVEAAINYLKSNKHLTDQYDTFWQTLIQTGLMGVSGKIVNKTTGTKDLSPEMEKEHDDYVDAKASAVMYENLFGKPAPVQPVKPAWLSEETRPFLPSLSDVTPEAINTSGVGTQPERVRSLPEAGVINDNAWDRFKNVTAPELNIGAETPETDVSASIDESIAVAQSHIDTATPATNWSDPNAQSAFIEELGGVQEEQQLGLSPEASSSATVETAIPEQGVAPSNVPALETPQLSPQAEPELTYLHTAIHPSTGKAVAAEATAPASEVAAHYDSKITALEALLKCIGG